MAAAGTNIVVVLLALVVLLPIRARHHRLLPGLGSDRAAADAPRCVCYLVRSAEDEVGIGSERNASLPAASRSAVWCWP